MKKNNLILFYFALILFFALSVFTPAAAVNPPAKPYDDHISGRVYTMVDEEGVVIMRTARRIVSGDEYIDMENNNYRVISVEGETATARLVEQIALAQPQPEGLLQRVQRLLSTAIPVQQGNRPARRVAVYNTHGAESYIRGDGTESKDPGGGILDVGDRFAKALEELGVDVIRFREPHTPHDAGAYLRSRRTVEEAMKKRPDAVIDIHRDAVPKEEYLEEVKGEQRVQVQLVVGRQNQNMTTNREFAQGLKNKADVKFPGLIKGIFMARGNYNQDMSPRAVLIEVGAHTNDKAQAKESVELFAQVVNAYLYGAAEDGRVAAPPGGRGTALRAILWVMAGLVAAVGIFLLISAGGFEQAKAKLRQFTGREFADTLGSPKGDKEAKSRNNDNKDQDGTEGG